MKPLAPIIILGVCLLAASTAFGQSVLVPAPQPVPCPVQAVQMQAVQTQASGDRVLAFQFALKDLAKQYRLRPLLAAKLRKASRDKAFCEMLASKYSAQLDEVALQTAGGDQFFAFLKFIMDNQDSILRLVITLIDLFSAAETESFAGC